MPQGAKTSRQGGTDSLSSEIGLMISEASKLAWYWLAHGLLRMTDDPPWSIELKRRYESWLNNWVKGGG